MKVMKIAMPHWKKEMLSGFYLVALVVLLGIFGFVLKVVSPHRTPASLQQISAAVVPHHDLVAGQRAVFMAELKKQLDQAHQSPETIILVSPNHYLAGQSKIQTTDKTWDIGNAQVSPNADLVQHLTSQHLATNEPGSFTNEHGIYNILSDIHANFPQARLLPLILKDVSEAELQKLNDSLSQSCQHCLLIASVDFSHYQPSELADLHDDKTIRDLDNVDQVDVLKNAEVDSGSSLTLMMMWSKTHQTEQFNLRNHTNSGTLLSNLDVPGTSHVYGWYQTGDKTKPEQFTSFVITPVEKYGQENRTIWGVDRVIRSEDPLFQHKVVAGKITAQGIKYFILPFDPANPTVLATGKTKQMLLKNLPQASLDRTIKLLINQQP